ncbi:MAG: YceI family protein [Planctomycetota bacterium]|jgi:polyisoprenoid-binding protein YceI
MKARIALPVFAVLAGLGALAALSPAGGLQVAEPGPRAGAYEVDPAHSTVVFRVNHLGVSNFYGRFNSPSGKVHFDPDDPSACSFEIEIQAKNVDTNNSRRDGHLKSADFFSAKQFPKITFKSTQVTKAGQQTFNVTGDLTLHGVTKSITVELDHVGTRELPRFGLRCGFDTSFRIKRSDFGMDFMADLLGDEITLMAGIEALSR